MDAAIAAALIFVLRVADMSIDSIRYIKGDRREWHFLKAG
jgi:hypothetical protein